MNNILHFQRNNRSTSLINGAGCVLVLLALILSNTTFAQTPAEEPEAPAAEESTEPEVSVEEQVEEAAEKASSELEEEAKEELEEGEEAGQAQADQIKEAIQQEKAAAKTNIEAMGMESQDSLMMSSEGVEVAPSTSQESADASLTETVETAKSPFSMALVLDNSVGVGTFVEGSSQRPSYTMSLDMRPMWKLSDNETVRLRMAVYSGLIQNADSSTTTKRQVLVTDLEARYMHSSSQELGAIKLGATPYAAVSFPTSLASRHATKIAAVRGGYNVSAKLNKFTLMLDTGVLKNFHRYTSPVVQRDDNVAIFRPQGAEDLGNSLTAIGRNNVEWSWSSQAMMSLGLSDKLTFSTAYAFAKSWTYVSYPDDEQTAEQADAGRGVRDVVQGVVDLYWQTPFEKLGLDLGITSAQSPKTADNSGFRFPFFDFKSTANNYTSVYLAAFYSL